ncbi:Rap1a/Tai family immunity protein [Halomonas denitrificans]
MLAARTLIVVAFLSLSFASPAAARTSQYVLNECTIDESDELYFQTMGFCYGFIAGAWDSLNVLEAVFGRYAPDAPEDMALRSADCIPSGANLEQLRAVLVKYLEDNPQVLHLPAVNGFIRAMHEAFC